MIENKQRRITPQTANALIYTSLKSEAGGAPAAKEAEKAAYEAFVGQRPEISVARDVAARALSVSDAMALPTTRALATAVIEGLPGRAAPEVFARARGILYKSMPTVTNVFAPGKNERLKQAREALASIAKSSEPEAMASAIRQSIVALRTTGGHEAYEIVTERGASVGDRLSRLRVLRDNGTTDSHAAAALKNCISVFRHNLRATGAAAVNRDTEAAIALRQPAALWSMSDKLESLLPQLVPSLFELYEARAARAYESLFAQHAIYAVPQELKTSWADFGKWMADYLRTIPETKIDRFVNELHTDFLRFGVRGWQDKAKSINAWREAPAGQARKDAMLALFEADIVSGPDLCARIIMLRDASMILGRIEAGPWELETRRFWSDELQPRTGRLHDLRNKDAVVADASQHEIASGITALHHPRIASQGDIPSVRPTTLTNTRLTQETVRRTLESGHGVAGGLSGSSNILTGLYKYARGNGLAMSLNEFTTATCLFLLYDGGHTLGEAMWPIERRLKQDVAEADAYLPPTYDEFRKRVGSPQFLEDAHRSAMTDLASNLEPVVNDITGGR